LRFAESVQIAIGTKEPEKQPISLCTVAGRASKKAAIGIKACRITASWLT
jgi:hypothetical protein